ncbi:uncharacterized protein BDR25DRAFT_297112 [Lindgomyces ingoldianus]|uniref:Uncharacterized protein n=1 Tax=Lindgomyces ingoldianus TaxID=673940 RepID=A0ACB6QC30_9PLEO|nr:uncharacterized protein BDR25DRAFT_297112 [Lindgomyces ingoldianus]KAF2464050.1 hypothetical protein BDR25DRAFT_297112 [Lindgomyces ingoldianus]
MGDVPELTHELSSLKIPDAKTIEISPHLSLQPPLSRRGRGPGLILVLNHYALLEKSKSSLDPPPLLKWAEEGFAVAQVLVPGKPDEFPLQQAVDELRKLEGCEEGGFGLISYLRRLPFYIEEPACLCPDIKAIISYSFKPFRSIDPSHNTLPAQLLHISGKPAPRRESISVVPDDEVTSSQPCESQGEVKQFRYVDANEGLWMLPADESYHASSANLSHSRSLSFLKPLLGGPYFNLEAIWDEHCRFEFVERDVEKTMATMVAEPYVNHIPTMTGGIGKDRLTAFYTHHFIFSNPADTKLELVSRTVGIDRVIDEFVFKCTHNRVIDWLLPSIPPTNLPLAIPFTSIINIRGDRLYHEHISWDQATVLFQLGLLPPWLKFPYPINGKPAPEGKRYEVKTPSAGKETAEKLVEACGSVGSNRLIVEGEGEGGRWREVDE